MSFTLVYTLGEGERVRNWGRRDQCVRERGVVEGIWIKAFKGLKKFSLVVVGGLQVKIVSVHVHVFILCQSGFIRLRQVTLGYVTLR